MVANILDSPTPFSLRPERVNPDQRKVYVVRVAPIGPAGLALGGDARSNPQLFSWATLGKSPASEPGIAKTYQIVAASEQVDDYHGPSDTEPAPIGGARFWPRAHERLKDYYSAWNSDLFDELVEKSKSVRAREITLSRDLFYRTLRLVSCVVGQDEEDRDHVHPDTVFRASEIVHRTRSIAGEPFITSTVEGSMLLQWSFADGAVVDVYVDDAQSFPDAAVMSVDQATTEVEMTGTADLISILEKRASLAAAQQ